jgi:hypothetical protein
MPDHVWGQGKWGQARWDTRTADQAGLVLSGGTAALRLSRNLVAQNGSLALTGGAAALRLGRRLPAAAGTLALSGQAVTLVYTHAPGANHYTMTVELGTLTLIGKPAALDVTRRTIAPSMPLHMGRRRRDLLGPWVSR